MLKLLKHKIVSGALQFTIFIGVLIALLLAAIIMLTYSHSFFILQSKAIIEDIQLSNTAVNFLLDNSLISNDTLTINDLTTTNQKVEVQLSKWGIYNKGIVKTTNRKKIFYKTLLFGSSLSFNNRPTLYLQENYKPLAVVGNTIIKGMVFLPDQGVKPGIISGDGFHGKELINGIIKKSNAELPLLDKTFRKDLEDLLENLTLVNQNNFIPQNQLIHLTNSFLKPTKIYMSKDEIVLDNNQLTGNIILKSDKSITVKSTTILKDIILIAPIIEVQDNTKGNFQIIANKSIKIAKGCKLNYPSSLVLIQNKNKQINTSVNTFDNQIFIDLDSEIRGTVCYFESIKEDNFKTQIIVNPMARIIGEIYCQGNLELKGVLTGTVYTNQFVVNSSGSIFINHLYNAQLKNEDLPERFCGIPFEGTKKSVAKWLY